MKRTILKLALIFLFTTGYTQINQVEIVYKVKIYPKKDNRNKENIKVHKFLDVVYDQIAKTEMKLLVDNEKSVFKQIEILENDNERSSSEEMVRIIIGLDSQYFYDIKNESIIRVTEFDGVTYKISSNFINNWILIDENKMIDNYKCYKATNIKIYKDRHGNVNKIPIIAWYCPELPIPLGPKNYVGLPGLILELNEGNDRSTYYAKNIIINPKKRIILDEFPQGKSITEEEFEQMTEGLSKKWINSNKN